MRLATTPFGVNASNSILVPPANGSWSVGDWWIDRQNGTDSPSNGRARATPLKSFAYLTGLWGTISPVCPQSTTLHYLTDETTSTDPVLWDPIMLNGAVPAIVGDTPNTISAGVVITGVVPKSTAAGSNSLLQATFDGLTGTQELLFNHTHSSRAWTYKSLGANAFELFQPLVLAAVQGTPAVAEVNTWANNDVVDVLAPIKINIVRFDPTIANWTASINNQAYIYNATIYNPPGGSTLNLLYIGASVRIYECVNQRMIQILRGQSTGSSAFIPCLTNVLNKGGAVGIGTVLMNGGGLVTGSFTALQAVQLQGDFVIGASLALTGGGSTLAGAAFLDAGLFLTNGIMTSAGQILYGRGANNVNLVGTARFALTSGTFTAAFTAPALVGTGIVLNGASTGFSMTGGVISAAPVATTPGNLDTNAALANNANIAAFNPGGACVAKAA